MIAAAVSQSGPPQTTATWPIQFCCASLCCVDRCTCANACEVREGVCSLHCATCNLLCAQEVERLSVVGVSQHQRLTVLHPFISAQNLIRHFHNLPY